MKGEESMIFNDRMLIGESFVSLLPQEVNPSMDIKNGII